MKMPSETLLRLIPDWSSLHEELLQLLPTVDPAESELMDILVEYQPLVELWSQNLQNDQHGSQPDRLKSAVTELLLWSLLSKYSSPAKRKELLGALWQKLEKIIRSRAKELVQHLSSSSGREDQVEQYTQEAFLHFEDTLKRYDPAKNTMLRTFVKTVYRNRMINIAKSKVMRESRTDCLTEPDHPTDEFDSQDRFNEEQLEEIEATLQKIAAAVEADAERVIAFRKFMIARLEIAHIAREMGRSPAWVTKAHQRIRDQLRTMLLR